MSVCGASPFSQMGARKSVPRASSVVWACDCDATRTSIHRIAAAYSVPRAHSAAASLSVLLPVRRPTSSHTPSRALAHESSHRPGGGDGGGSGGGDGGSGGGGHEMTATSGTDHEAPSHPRQSLAPIGHSESPLKLTALAEGPSWSIGVRPAG